MISINNYIYNKKVELGEYLNSIGYKLIWMDDLIREKQFEISGHLVCFSSQFVTTPTRTNLHTDIFSLSHEIGHILDRKYRPIFNNKRSRKHKIFRLTSEFLAWIFGYYICKRFKVNTRGFWKHAWKCFKTYL